ncbi:restriction endonuclease subunit S [Bacillus velezensis]|uniref:restriction endonuclease subunit S n=1 Tax=Bacillus velezensis TaxID=492670 RepID=UPI00280860AC|nr:restriction endonuclease subunit S [Bacillus velezensis]MDQ8056339.1 restriction endonuclease subunit S [Bacillus velezensis]
MSKKRKTIEELLEEALVSEGEQPYEIPDNWVWVKLDTSKKDRESFGDGDWILSENIDPNGEVRLIQLSDIGQGKFLNKSSRYISMKTFEELRCREIFPGDILISRMAHPIARSCIVPDLKQKLITAVDIAYLRPNEKIFDTEYLNYMFNSIFFRTEAEGVARGTTRLRITRKNLGNLAIPFPPLNEQKRIAEKVERLLSKIEEAKRLIEEAKGTFELRRAAILDKAFRGELTRKWRGENFELEPAEKLIESIKLDKERVYEENCKRAEKEGTRKPRKAKIKLEKSDYEYLFEGLPKSWKITYFDEITAAKENAIKAGPFGSALKKEFYTPSGYKIYGQEQVIKGDSSYGAYYIDEEKYKELESCAITKGDLLISLVGTIGKTLVIPEEYEQGIINPRLIKISLHEEVNPFFIATYFESFLAKMIMSENSHGGTMQILNMSILKSLPIPLPPKQEQDKILEIVNNLLDTERVSKQLIGIESHLNTLKQGILSKAFRGELGTNDPNEENAIELLKEMLQEQVK